MKRARGEFKREHPLPLLTVLREKISGLLFRPHVFYSRREGSVTLWGMQDKKEGENNKRESRFARAQAALVQEWPGRKKKRNTACAFVVTPNKLRAFCLLPCVCDSCALFCQLLPRRYISRPVTKFDISAKEKKPKSLLSSSDFLFVFLSLPFIICLAGNLKQTYFKQMTYQ